MKIIRRNFLLGAAALIATPAILRAQTTSHVVGTLFPMSGANAEYGALYQNAVQLALGHIAEDGQLQGAIDLRVVDSQGSAQGGAVGMSRLVNVDQAAYVLVGFTGVSKAAAPIGERAEVVMVNGGGVGPDLATLSPYFWNVIPLANKEVLAALPFVQENGIKRVAMIYTEDPSGLAIRDELEKDLPSVGSELVQAFGVAPTHAQFASVAAQIRSLNADAVFIASNTGTQIVQIIKQLRDNGVTQQLMTYSSANLPSVSTLPESEGMVFTGQSADWAANEPMLSRFVNGWRETYSSEPTTYALNYYNGTMLFSELARGLEKAGQPVTGRTLNEERQRVKTFPLAGGSVTFADDGTASTGVQLNRIVGGRIEKIG